MEKEKKKGGKAKWIVLAIVVIVVIAVVAGGGGGDDTATPPEDIQYTVVTADEMMDTLSNNAVQASDLYKDQYVEVSGRLSVIDSSGDYIAIHPKQNAFSLTGVTCYIKNDEQLEAVKSMSVDQDVTVRGKVTSVGEVMGYSLDIVEIVP